MTRGELREIVKINLSLSGITTGITSDDDLNDIIQDTYNYIVAVSKCNIQRTNGLSFTGGKNYYAMNEDLNVTEYLGTIAIFSNLSNMWLRDNIPLRAFDTIRIDWELWDGAPQFWAPHSFKYIAVVPHMASTTGTFDLLYWGIAPALVNDSSTFIFATDMQKMLEFRCTAIALEESEEAAKADVWFGDFEEAFAKFKERTKQLAKLDRAIRVAQTISL